MGHGRLHMRPAARLVVECQGRQKRRRGDSEKAESRMKQEYHPEQHRRPGHVENAERTRRSGEAADRVKVAPWRGRGFRGGAAQRGIEDRTLEEGLKARPGAHGDAAATLIEDHHDQVEKRRQHEQRHQRLLRPAGDHPLVELQQEERAGKHQQVDHEAEQHERRGNRAKRAACGAQLAAAFDPVRGGPVAHCACPAAPVMQTRAGPCRAVTGSVRHGVDTVAGEVNFACPTPDPPARGP